MANIRFNILDKLTKFGFNETDFQKFISSTDDPLTNAPVDKDNAPGKNLQLNKAMRDVGLATESKSGRSGERVLSGEGTEEDAGDTGSGGGMGLGGMFGGEGEVEEDMGLPAFSKGDKSPEAKASRRSEAQGRLEAGEGRSFDTWKAMNRSEKIGAALQAFSEFAAVASSQDPSKALSDMMAMRSRARERELERDQRETERKELFAHQQGMQEASQEFTGKQAEKAREYSVEDRDLQFSFQNLMWDKNKKLGLETKEGDQLFALTMNSIDHKQQKELLGIQNSYADARLDKEQRLRLDAYKSQIAIDEGMRMYGTLVDAGVDPLKAAKAQSYVMDTIRGNGEIPYIPDQETRMLLDQGAQLRKLKADMDEAQQIAATAGAMTNAIMTDPTAVPNREGIKIMKALTSHRRSAEAGSGEDAGPGGLFAGVNIFDGDDLNTEAEFQKSKAEMEDYITAGKIPPEDVTASYLAATKGRADDDDVREDLAAAGIPMRQIQEMVPELDPQDGGFFKSEGKQKRQQQRTYVEPILSQLPAQFRDPFRMGTDPLHGLPIEEQQEIANRLKTAWMSGRGSNRLALEEEMRRLRLKYGDPDTIPGLAIQ